jgi:hypothetical protein
VLHPSVAQMRIIAIGVSPSCRLLHVVPQARR